jgi:ABC-type antimicrobial peptide transport system permease subunit
VVALVGVALGLAAAVALSRFLSTALYDVSPTDPATYAGVATLVLLTSMVATYVPARRAAATTPLEALRQD